MAGANEILKKRKENTDRLEKEAPDLYNGFNELMKHYYKHGILGRKYKELMAVTASVATRLPVRCAPSAGLPNGKAARGTLPWRLLVVESR